MTTTSACSTSAIDDEVLGPVLRPGDAEFAAEVSGWNLAVTPTPALVVGAMCAEDIAAAVRYAPPKRVFGSASRRADTAWTARSTTPS